MHDPNAAPPATPARLDRLPSLTGIRAPCCLLVVAAHAVVAPDLYRDRSVQTILGGILFALGTASVSLFFVMSGFVLAWSARPSDTARGFWRRRFVRIFSNHVVVWAASLALLAAYGTSAAMTTLSGPLEPGPAVANLFLVQTYYPSLKYMVGVNGVTWSLAAECFFYLAFPLLYASCRRIPASRLWPCAALTILLSLGVPSLSLLIGGPLVDQRLPLPLGQFWFAFMFPLSRLPEFLLGILLARIVAEGRWRPLGLRCVIPLPLLAIASLALLPPIFAFGPYFALPMGLLCAELVSRDLRGIPSVLHKPAMIYVGDRSFALYIAHYVVIMYVRRLLLGPSVTFSTPVATLCVLFLLIPLSLAAAILLYRFVERPAVAWLSAPAPAPREHAAPAQAGAR